MRPVEAQAAAVQKRLVVQPLGVDDPGHGVHQRRVRRRADGDPLGPQGLGRVRQPRVHGNDGDALLFGLPQIVQGLGAELRFQRVVAPEDNKAAVQPVRRVVARGVGAVHQRRHLAGAGRAVGVVGAQVAPVQRQQPHEQHEIRNRAADTGADADEAGAGAVGVADARPLPHDLVHGLGPGNAHEFALAAPADPLHGPAQPVFRQKGLMIAQPLHAGRQRYLAGAVLRRLRREPLDLPVLHVHVDHALAAAVAEPHGVDDLFLCHKRTSAIVFTQRLYHKGGRNARR